MDKRQRALVVGILVESFADNPSVNYVLKQDAKKAKRLQLLMRYSLYYGEKFGRVYLSEDEQACAILLDPRRKKFTIGAILWDIRLVVGCMGLSNVKKVLKREAVIKKHHPTVDFMHLWYIGVNPAQQGKGLGGKLLETIMKEAKSEQLPIYLETSNPRNFKFYRDHGFELTGELDELGYPLKMFLKR